MRDRLWRLLAAALGAVGFGCSTANSPLPSPLAAAATADFAALIGDFRGTLQMGEHLSNEVPMQLLVAPRAGESHRFTFRLTYGEGPAADVRNYLLIVDEAATGRCHVDEQNGIELPGRMVRGELVTVFAVGGNVLDVRYRVVPEGIEFSLLSYQPTDGQLTGIGREGPEVRGIGKVAVQRALLHRTR